MCHATTAVVFLHLGNFKKVINAKKSTSLNPNSHKGYRELYIKKNNYFTNFLTVYVLVLSVGLLPSLYYGARKFRK